MPGNTPMSHATNGRRDILAPEATTLAELLQARGYRTMAIVLNRNVFPVFGFSQGFDQYTEMTRGGARKLNQMFLDWLGPACLGYSNKAVTMAGGRDVLVEERVRRQLPSGDWAVDFEIRWSE